jgi:GNAT superfamily N-acetyltransferase
MPTDLPRAVAVRPAVPADLDCILEAAERLAAFGPPPWRPARQIVDAEAGALRGFFACPPPGSALLVAEFEGEGVVGFVFLERAIDYFTRREHGHVGIVAVSERAEGRGAGAALMQAAEVWAREQGFPHLTLNVFAGNHRARTLYERLGYAPETLRYVKAIGTANG